MGLEPKNDRDIVIEAAHRILTLETLEGDMRPGLSSRLQTQRMDSTFKSVQEEKVDFDNTQLDLHQRLLARLEQIVSGLEDIHKVISPDSIIIKQENTSTFTPIIRVSVLLEGEWHALVRYCVCLSISLQKQLT